RDYR
ncbi:transketolase, thiamine diphosphate binding domain protein, partial [Vibrio cholerae O1 str. EDC-022]